MVAHVNNASIRERKQGTANQFEVVLVIISETEARLGRGSRGKRGIRKEEGRGGGGGKREEERSTHKLGIWKMQAERSRIQSKVTFSLSRFKAILK